MRSQARALFVVVALCSFFALSATASADYSFKGTFAGPGVGSGDGELDTPGRAAVEQSTGNLFIVDSGNNRVQVFKPKSDGTAEYLTQFGNADLSEPWGIAIDEDAGQTHVYVADAGNERIVKYDSDGGATPTFSVDPTFSSPPKGTGAGEVEGFHVALAIDPTTRDLLAADTSNKRIDRFNSDGSADGSFDGATGSGSPGAFSGPIDLAVNSTGDVYVIDANGPNLTEGQGTSRVLRYSATGEYKAELMPLGPRRRSATLAVSPFDDSVVVSGDQDVVYEFGVPKLYVFDARNQPMQTVELGEVARFGSNSGVTIASGVGADHLFSVLDVGHFSGFEYGEPQIQAFERENPQAARIVAQRASVSQHEAVLKATVNPGKASTTYHFEYGSTAGYGKSTVEKTIPAGAEDVTVETPVAGLESNHTYHFRVVVENTVGGEAGTDQTFTTELPTSEACINTAIRLQQHSTYLPDCRAYEMVSPPDKSGYPVFFARNNEGQGATRNSLSGNAALFQSYGSFANARSGMPTSYRAQRGPGGWAAMSVSPPPGTSTPGAFFTVATWGMANPELTAGLLGPFGQGTGDFFDPTDTNEARDVYWQAAGGNPVLMSRGDGSERVLTGDVGSSLGMSADGGVVGFETASHLIPADAGRQDSEDLYIRTEGRTELPNSDGGQVLRACGSRLGAGRTWLRNAISADGSTVVFQTPGPNAVSGSDPSCFEPSRVYLHRTGGATIEVSASQRSTPDPGGRKRATFAGASSDGRVVFIESEEMLTDEAPAGGGVYRFHLNESGGGLEFIHGTEQGGGQKSHALAVSDDGSHLYFVATHPIAGDGVEGSENLYLSVGQHVKWLAVASGQSLGIGIPWSERAERISVTPSGSGLAISTQAQLTRVPTRGQWEVYFYQDRSGAFNCVSCDPAGQRPAGSELTTEASLSAIGNTAPGEELPVINSDGDAIFFMTGDQLVPQDSNRRRDVYEYRDGRVHLISSGRDPDDSLLVGSSSDGRSVFFVTASTLVGSDIDDQADMYVARSDGGFAEAAEPPTPSCIGEACQTESVVQLATAPGSATFVGPANQVQVKSKAKRNAKHRRHAKRRKHVRHRKHGRRHGRAGQGRWQGKHGGKNPSGGNHHCSMRRDANAPKRCGGRK